MAMSTPATLALARTGVPFTLHAYDYDPGAEGAGLQAARALGEAPARVLKTLIVLVDGKPACVVVPSDHEVSLKAVAAALRGKGARMMPPADAERTTGYRIGGISPFGQRKRAPTVVEITALAQDLVFVNGGQRGLQIRLAPGDLVEALGAATAALVA